MKKIKIGLLLATICTASIYAQVPAVTAVPAASAIPDVATPAIPDAPPAIPDTVVAAVPDSIVAIDSAKIAEVVPVDTTPTPPKVEPPPAPVVLPAPAPIAKEPLVLKYHFGARVGFGLSALRGHVALTSPAFNGYSIKQGQALSLGAGIAFGVEINDLLTVAPELQYTWYRANGEYSLKNGSLPYVNGAGVNLHSFELPVLARFSFSKGLMGLNAIYAEVGPQFGYNFSANIYKDYVTTYKNGDIQNVETNRFAFGPTLGFGANLDGNIFLGLRGHLGVLEYANNTNGYPWTLQISVTKFFF